MIKAGTLFAGALIAIVAFSAPSFAQSLSQYDVQQQRANDIRQMTSDAGSDTIDYPSDRATPGVASGPSARDRQQLRLNVIRQQTSDSGLNTINRPLDRAPWGVASGPSAKDRQLQAIYTEHDETLD